MRWAWCILPWLVLAQASPASAQTGLEFNQPYAADAPIAAPRPYPVTQTPDGPLGFPPAARPDAQSLPAPVALPEPIGVPRGPAATEEMEGEFGSDWFVLPGALPAWHVPALWEGSLELGINGTEGNAEALSFRTGGSLKRKLGLWELTSAITYAKALADGNETQHNAIYNGGYERALGETAWSHFGKTNLEYDEFKAFDLRLAMNAGLGYRLIKTDDFSFKTRFGAGVSHEFDSPDVRWVPEAVFGVDYAYQISQRQKLILTTDYLPEWENFHNYRMVSDLGWEVFLDEASDLSLKLSVNNRYDSTPNGAKPNDVIYSVLLLWKI